MGRRTNTAVWLPNQNRWQIKVQKDGVRKTFTSAKTGRTGQREANRKADAWLDEGIINTRITVEKAYTQWLEEVKTTTSYSNWRPIDSRWRTRVQPEIGRVKVENLTEAQLQAVVNKAFAAGRSKKYLQNLCVDLRAFCKWLRLNKMSTLLPETLRVPKGARTTEKAILQPEHLKLLFSVDTTTWRRKEVTDPYINAYRFSAVTGLRPGELLGLRWDDIQDGMIQIHRSINVFGEETHGKNDNALRALPMTTRMQEILSAQRKLTGQEESVFCILNEQHYYRCWSRYCDAHSIPHIPPYNLRHTFVSVAKTLPEGTVKSVVGHSRQMDTFGVYAHLLRGETQQTAQALENRFSQILENSESEK